MMMMTIEVVLVGKRRHDVDFYPIDPLVIHSAENATSAM